MGSIMLHPAASLWKITTYAVVGLESMLTRCVAARARMWTCAFVVLGWRGELPTPMIIARGAHHTIPRT
jgi:hypothetical protein